MFYFFYYLPIGINAKLRKVPVLTYSYAALCVLVFVLFRYFPGRVPFEFDRLAYFPDQASLATAFTAAFLHSGYFHLIGNLVFLVLFGRYLEDRMGAVLYSTVFLGCAAFGNVLQGMFNTYVMHDPALGVAGASGAVSGILGALVVRFYASKLEVVYWAFMPLQAFTRGGKVEVPVILALVLWFLMQFVQGLLQVGGSADEVAYVAHISGFALGLAIALASGHAEEARVDRLLQRAAEYMQKGQAYAAQGDYLEYVALRPLDADAHAGLARAAAMAGDRAGARQGYRRACELLIDEKRRGDCEAVYQEALRGLGDFALGAEYQLGLAFGLERNLKPALAVRAYETFAGEYPQHSESPFALLRAAGIRLNALSEPKAAEELYGRLIEKYPNDVWVDFAKEQRRKMAGQRAWRSRSALEMRVSRRAWPRLLRADQRRVEDVDGVVPERRGNEARD